METLIEEFINDDVIAQAPIERKKKLLPAAQYLKTFKEKSHHGVKSVDMDVFYSILEHLIEWEKMEINEAIFKTRYRQSDPNIYMSETFDNYEG